MNIYSTVVLRLKWSSEPRISLQRSIFGHRAHLRGPANIRNTMSRPKHGGNNRLRERERVERRLYKFGSARSGAKRPRRMFDSFTEPTAFDQHHARLSYSINIIFRGYITQSSHAIKLLASTPHAPCSNNSNQAPVCFISFSGRIIVAAIPSTFKKLE